MTDGICFFREGNLQRAVHSALRVWLGYLSLSQGCFFMLRLCEIDLNVMWVQWINTLYTLRNEFTHLALVTMRDGHYIHTDHFIVQLVITLVNMENWIQTCFKHLLNTPSILCTWKFHAPYETNMSKLKALLWCFCRSSLFLWMPQMFLDLTLPYQKHTSKNKKKHRLQKSAIH